MKVRGSILAAAGLTICNLTGVAQTNPAVAEATAPAVEPVATNTPAAPVAGTNGPAQGQAVSTNSPAQRQAIIPLIVMDEVPLTDAIGNLARQAGLNYLMDPKVGFGQPGPDGKLVAQPTVSIRWENVTAEQALAALLNNYGLQSIEDPKSKVARITMKDPLALPPLSTRVIQLHYASPTNMLNHVTAALTDKRSRVLADIRTSQLVVIATDPEMEEVDRLLERLDTPTKQVLIEARLMETTVNPSTTKGVDWTGTFQSQNITFGNGVLASQTSSGGTAGGGGGTAGGGGGGSSMFSSSTTTFPGTPITTMLPGGRSITSMPGSSTTTILDMLLGTGGFSWNTASGLTPATGFLNADGVRAVLSFLNTYGEVKILSCPRTVTLDNQQATIEVGTMFPIVNTIPGTVQVAGGSIVTYSNLTVKLAVTPRISANNYVQLQVDPQIVRLGNQVKSTVGDAVSIVYEFNKRELKTTVMIPSGNTLVMGGLIEDNIQQNTTKVPLLGDIPVLGMLFRSDNKTRTKSNLIVFLTPTIVQEQDFQPTKSVYLRTPVPTNDAIEPDWGAWDSGKPYDWSKNKKTPPKVPAPEAAPAATPSAQAAAAPASPPPGVPPPSPQPVLPLPAAQPAVPPPSTPPEATPPTTPPEPAPSTTPPEPAPASPPKSDTER